VSIITIVFIFIPTCITFALYVHIFIVVHRASKAAGQTKREKKEARVALILFTLYATFVASNVPFAIYTILGVIMSLNARKHMILILWQSRMFVSTINPLLYAVMFPAVRQIYKQIFACFRSSQVHNTN
jgi:hypothetical protein